MFNLRSDLHSVALCADAFKHLRVYNATDTLEWTLDPAWIYKDTVARMYDGLTERMTNSMTITCFLQVL